MLNDLEIMQGCADIYADQPEGFDVLFPTRFGFAGIRHVDNIAYLYRRGSKTPEDWWVDFDATPVPTPIGGVHAGFYGDVIWTRARIERALGDRYVMAGHSLGGGETSIHAAILTSLKRPPLRVVLFGCPRPYYLHGRQILAEAKVPVASYVTPGDPVPTVPRTTFLWPYVEAWAPATTLGDFADPKDTSEFRAHHTWVYLAGLRALEGNKL